MDSFNEAWDIICDYCRQRITDVAYKTWISKIEPVNLDFSQGKAIPNGSWRFSPPDLDKMLYVLA